jgi:MoaA/NifB/PqqE/SkfB family radical SAM enzyme
VGHLTLEPRKLTARPGTVDGHRPWLVTSCFFARWSGRQVAAPGRHRLTGRTRFSRNSKSRRFSPRFPEEAQVVCSCSPGSHEASHFPSWRAISALVPTSPELPAALRPRPLRLSRFRRKWRLLVSYLRQRPLWLTWQVTNRCNFECSFCNYWNEPFDIDAQLTPAQFGEAAAKLSRIGTMMVSLAGGEPLLRRDLPEIIDAVSGYHFPFLTTNGWAINEELARTLWDAGLWGVSISIDYANPARHDEERGREGAFRHAVRAVEVFSKSRTRPHQRVNINAVLMKDNLDEMEGLIQVAREHDALFMVQPYGFLKTGSRDPMPEQSLSETLLDLSRRHRHFNSNPEFLRRFDQHITEGVEGCRAGRSFFNIDQWGNISKCVEYREESLGKVQELSAEAIWGALKAEYESNSCTACWYNCRGEIESLYTLRGLRSGLPRLFTMPSTHCSAK